MEIRYNKSNFIRLKQIWLTFSLIKVAYMFFALLIYAKLSSLGDTARYLSGKTYGSAEWFWNSSHMMDLFAHSSALLLGPILGNLPFVALSVFGVYYPISKLNLTNKELCIILSLLSIPSFGIWTSIASKESVSVFFMGIILGYIIDIIKRKKEKNYVLIILAFYLCGIFKPQYLIGILALLSFLLISRFFALKGIGKLVLLALVFAASIFLLYTFRHIISDLSFKIPDHFNADSNSTRKDPFWINEFDFFWRAHYGMYISFMGPTISEAIVKPLHLMVLIESYFILSIFILGLIRLCVSVFRTGKLNTFFLSILLIPSLWILLVHYPFGVINPGSAIRYRANFFAFLVILLYFCYTEYKSTFKSHEKRIT